MNEDMKTLLSTFSLVVLFATSALSAGMITSRAQNWSMIQSVGGLRVGNPVKRDDGTIFLPIVCNVSGLETITTKPQAMNSSLVVRRIWVKVTPRRIQIQLITCIVDNRHTSRTQGESLGKPLPGHYAVEYLNPDRSTVAIREIEIE